MPGVAAQSQKQRALRFALVNGHRSHDVALRVGQVGFLGRASRCSIVAEDISASSEHVEFSVAAGRGGGLVLRGLDKSQNGTGLVGPAEGGGPALPSTAEVRPLSRRAPQELHDGCRLIVPLRRKGGSGRVEVDEGNLWVVRIGRPPPAPADGGRSEAEVEEEEDEEAEEEQQEEEDEEEEEEEAEALPGPTSLPKARHGENGLAARSSASARPTAGSQRGSPASTQQPVASAAAAAAAGARASAALRAAKPTAPPSKSLGPLPDAEELPDAYSPKTRAGRWRYDSKIGEGGLGVVYRATDMREGGLGEVAVKTLKHHDRRDWGKQYAFAMHRESQWSMQRLHNQADPRFRAEEAALFARYLEDHTGFSQMGPCEFDVKRRLYEAPSFDWEREVAALHSKPYVVMELVCGEPLYAAIDRGFVRQSRPRKPDDLPPLSTLEKRDVLIQAARALHYMSSFGLIHRDFRGCNMHLVERSRESGRCTLTVLDLGVMISSEDGQQWNTNQAVQAFRRRGETEEKRQRYDWLPWEVRAGADGSGLAKNFSHPPHSFDIFSLGVLILHLLLGRTEGRAALESIRLHPTENKMPDTRVLGIEADLLRRMLGDAHQRPHPSEVLQALHLEVPGAAPADPVAQECPPGALAARAAGAEGPPGSRQSRDQRSHSRRKQPHRTASGAAVSPRSRYRGAETPVPHCPSRSHSREGGGRRGPSRRLASRLAARSRSRSRPRAEGGRGKAARAHGSTSEDAEEQPRPPAPAAGKLAEALASLAAAASGRQDGALGQRSLEELLAGCAGWQAGLQASECWVLTFPLCSEDVEALDRCGSGA